MKNNPPVLHVPKVKKIKVTIKGVQLGSPKTTFEFNGSLESHGELRKAVLFMVIVNYSDRINTKISKGKTLLR